MINSCVKLEPLTQQSPILRKGLIQASLETLRVLWELKGKSDSTHKAIHTLPLGNWQAKVIVSEWIRCHSLDTIPPNGIKVAQCTLLLHQRDIPTLVKLGAWKHSPLRPSLLKSGFSWKMKSPVFLSTIQIYKETVCHLPQKKCWFVFVVEIKGPMVNFETCK